MPINYISNHDYEQSAPEQWYPDGWDMDRLIVPFQGSKENEQDFMDSLVLWDPSDIDEDMFLANWSSDKDRQWPTIELTYIGKRGGELSPAKYGYGSDIRTASSVSDGVVGHSILTFSVNIEFYAPGTTANWISKVRGAAPSGGFAPDPSGDAMALLINMTSLEASVYTLGLDVHTVLVTYFGYLFENTIQSEEIVPAKYWRNSQRKVRNIVTKPASTSVIP